MKVVMMVRDQVCLHFLDFRRKLKKSSGIWIFPLSADLLDLDDNDDDSVWQSIGPDGLRK